jgi:succinate dehydrogenase / fumarate reductase flavoprotein subunit
VLGEANFSDHGANRLGASALMQGLADGYFVVPYTMGDFLAGVTPGGNDTAAPEFKAAEASVLERQNKLLSIKGKKTATQFHRDLGKLMWENCGMSRSEKSLKEALTKIPEMRERFWKEAGVPGSNDGMNVALEEAGRVADLLEFAELLCTDALERRESCGGHYREEYQDEGEAKRDDVNFQHVAAWVTTALTLLRLVTLNLWYSPRSNRRFDPTSNLTARLKVTHELYPQRLATERPQRPGPYSNRSGDWYLARYVVS